MVCNLLQVGGARGEERLTYEKIRGGERFTSGRIRFTIHTMIGIDDCSEYIMYFFREEAGGFH